MTNMKYYAVIYFDILNNTNNVEAVFSNEESAIAYYNLQDNYDILYNNK